MRGHGEEKHAEAPPPKPPSFVEVPEMMVNLVGAPGERVQYLQRQGRARGQGREAGRGDQAATCRASPTCSRPICANCGPRDLNGSAGLFRLKEELTKRVNNAVAPHQVNAVLFKEIVVQ